MILLKHTAEQCRARKFEAKKNWKNNLVMVAESIANEIAETLYNTDNTYEYYWEFEKDERLTNLGYEKYNIVNLVQDILTYRPNGFTVEEIRTDGQPCIRLRISIEH